MYCSIQRKACVIILLSVLTQTTAVTTECLDISNWKDSSGDGCDWYSGKPGLCDSLGDCCEKNGYTASTACCDCGGGEIIEITGPTPAPKGKVNMKTDSINNKFVKGLLLMFRVSQMWKKINV